MTTSWNTFTPKQREKFNVLLDGLLMSRTLREASEEATGHYIGFREIYAYVTNPDIPMDNAMREALIRKPRLRADLARLIENRAQYHAPMMAAASGGAEGVVRTGEEFTIWVTPSPVQPSEVYVVIELNDKNKAPPSHLFVRVKDGLQVKEVLPKIHRGRFQILTTEDSELVQGINDIHSELYML